MLFVYNDNSTFSHPKWSWMWIWWHFFAHMQPASLLKIWLWKYKYNFETSINHFFLGRYKISEFFTENFKSSKDSQTLLNLLPTAEVHTTWRKLKTVKFVGDVTEGHFRDREGYLHMLTLLLSVAVTFLSEADFHIIFVMKFWLSYQQIYLWRTGGSRRDAPYQDLTEGNKKNE